MQVSIKMLRQNVKEIIDTVERGETVMITRRGKVCAKIVPAESSEVADKVDVFGLWADHEDSKDVDAFVRRLREPRKFED